MTQSAETPQLGPSPATEVGDRWALTLGDCSLEVDPRRGARICSFSLKGRNILTGPEVDSDNFGSTFWTSPQSEWEWPPVPEIDNQPYTVVESEEGLVCAGSFSSKLGVIVTKRFAAVPARAGFRVEYEVSNQSSQPIKLAPWEVSRVRGGMTLFRSGRAVEQPESHDALAVEQRDGVTWLDYNRAAIDGDQKLFAHSSAGWLAHINENHLLLKSFEPVPFEKQAPGEAMIELFASGSKDYIELEQQGAYGKVGLWKSVVWRVYWQLIELPPSIPIHVGSEALVRFIETKA